jgi:superfamily II DNA/RNA helicase
MSPTFARLGLPDALVEALAVRGIVAPFPVQAATIPDVLAGRDVSGKAPTGSGKTLAFGLPLLAGVDGAEPRRPRALILAPTRELADQIKRELAPLARAVGRTVAAVYGGVGYGPQKGALRKGVDVLVATPGRLEDLIEQGTVDLGATDIVVIDEADRMADMGFLPAVRRILDRTSPRRQTLLFSATLDGDVAVLSRAYQHDPVRHEAGTVEPESIDARHHFWLVERQDRARHAADLVDYAGRSIVFTRTRHGADRVAKQLSKLGVSAVAMHGGRSQSQRSRALHAFDSGDARALIATDVAARGIHIDDVASVIHFDLPGDAKDYLHRSGRTARAGATGIVVSLVTADQQRDIRRIQHDLDLEGPIEAPRIDALHVGGHRMGGRPASGPERKWRDEAETTQRVYVANLPHATSSEDVRALFERYGRVQRTTVITDRRTGRSKGYGFVEMMRPAAMNAIAGLHGSSVGGREITVRPARPRRQRGRS